MSFYDIKLSKFDLYKMHKELGNKDFVKGCEHGVDKLISLESDMDEIIDYLKKSNTLYYFLGKREGNYLLCADSNKYLVDDNRDKISEGIYMADAYINKYEDINLGILVSYNNGDLNIQPALEGESIECRRYEVVEDCGDLNDKIKDFLNRYII